MVILTRLFVLNMGEGKKVDIHGHTLKQSYGKKHRCYAMFSCQGVFSANVNMTIPASYKNTGPSPLVTASHMPPHKQPTGCYSTGALCLRKTTTAMRANDPKSILNLLFVNGRGA